MVELAAALRILNQYLLGGGSSCVATHGVSLQPRLLADPVQVHTPLEQGMNLAMASAGDLRSATQEPPLLLGFAGQSAGRRRGRRRLSAGLFSPFARAPAVLARDPVDGVGEVAEQMPPVSHLDRVRRTDAGTLGVASRPTMGCRSISEPHCSGI